MCIYLSLTVAACLLLQLSDTLVPQQVIDSLRSLRGSGAIQTIKVMRLQQVIRVSKPERRARTVLSLVSQRGPSVFPRCLGSLGLGAELVLPLLNSTAALPACSSPSLATCGFLLLIPAHNSLSCCPVFCCSHSPQNLDICLTFLPWFWSIFVTKLAVFVFCSYHISRLAVIFWDVSLALVLKTAWREA